MKVLTALQFFVAGISIALAIVAIILTVRIADDTKDDLSEIRELSGKIEWVVTHVLDQQIALIREKDAQLSKMMDEVSAELRHVRESQATTESQRMELDQRLQALERMKKELDEERLPEFFFKDLWSTPQAPTPDSPGDLRQKLFPPSTGDSGSLWKK